MITASAPIDYRDIAGGYSSGKPITVCVHCFYEEITTQGFLFSHSNASIGHNLLKPWVELYNYGLANGLRFVTVDQVASMSEIDAVLFSDRPAAASDLAKQLLSLAVPKYLYLCETEVIKPDNWDRSYHQLFDKVFTSLDDWVDHVHYIKGGHATDATMTETVESLQSRFATRKLCTLIAGAKLTQHPNELYSARLHSIDWWQTHAALDFDLYGVGWQALNLPSYRGATDDKLLTLGNYRFAICYENAHGYAGYITKKIFDCMLAGTVPVYWGAPNIAQWVPSDCFIDRTLFTSEAELHAHLQAMDAQTHGAYLERIAAFLTSAEFYPFSIDNFITTLSAHIAKDVKHRRGESPSVSVCIPSYQYGRYLGAAIESALDQGIPDLEVLVFDNHSTDNTSDVLQTYYAHPQVRVMRNTRNHGSDTNWNNAFRCAAGRYFTILCADDFFQPDHLREKLSTMDAHPSVALAYCPCLWVDGNGQALNARSHNGHPNQSYVGGRDELADLLTYDSYITPSAAILRRSAFESLGWVTERALHGASDWDLWIRLAERFPDFAYFHEARVCYRVHDAQHTQQLLKTADFLEDHIRILQNVFTRGGGAMLTHRASEIAALLWTRFHGSPQMLAEPLRGQVMDLEVQLLNQLLERHVVAAMTDKKRGAILQGFQRTLQGALPLMELVELAQCLIESAQPELGCALYRLWLSHTHVPECYAVAYNLAVAMQRRGDAQQALMYFTYALAWNSQFDLGRLGLALFLLERQHRTEAAQHLNWLTSVENGTLNRNPDVARSALTLLQQNGL